jgi:hypothetical protein
VPTSVHIPKKLLAAVDRKARTLKISRNRLIIHALEKEVEQRGWPPGFLEYLGVPDPELEQAVDEMMAGIRTNRRGSKPPPRL